MEVHFFQRSEGDNSMAVVLLSRKSSYFQGNKIYSHGKSIASVLTPMVPGIRVAAWPPALPAEG